jgi:ATP-dependent DNA ligase
MQARSATASTRSRPRSSESSGAARNENAAYAKRIAHKGVWVEPKLLAEIEYRAKSAQGKVRHPLFNGLREDH